MIEPDEQFLTAISAQVKMEEDREHARAMAHMYWLHYGALLAEGFDVNQAMFLIERLQNTLFSSRMPPSNG